MGRWDISNDTRSLQQTSDRTPERTETIHREHDARITPLPDRVSPRSRDDLGEAREHHLTLPDGRDREEVRESGRVYHLRGSEVDLLERAGRYRVTFTADLKHDASHARFDEDLRSLKEQGLMEERTVTRLREGTVADVVSVTSRGQSVLDHHRDPDHDRAQVYYGGWVKPGEVWHDARLFQMVREVESELAREGASVQRVMLDDELKANARLPFFVHPLEPPLTLIRAGYGAVDPTDVAFGFVGSFGWSAIAFVWGRNRVRALMHNTRVSVGR